MKNIKSERYFIDYLKNISDKQLIQFYQDVEWTPFPLLVLDEYARRFKSTNKKETLEKLKIQSLLEKIKSYELNKLATKQKTRVGDQLKIQASLAKKKSAELSKFATKKGVKVSKDLKNLTQQKVTESVLAARKMTTTSKENIELIEKLGRLRKTKLITESEFKKKKKEILARI